MKKEKKASWELKEVTETGIEAGTEIGLETEPRKRRRSFSLEKRRAVAGYIFVMPFIIGFIVFMLFPLVTSLIWSMAKTDSGVRLNEAGKGVFYITQYVGFQNWLDIFTNNYIFAVAFGDTILQTIITTPFIIVFALFIAIMLNRKIKLRGMFRVIYFLPVLLGTGLVFTNLSSVTDLLKMPDSLISSIKYFFEGNSFSLIDFVEGLINSIIKMFWSMGVQIIIFLAGLQGISETYYEAAKVDNANWWDQLWKITIPMISPMILLNIIYTIINSFRAQTNPIGALIISKFDAGSQHWVEMCAMGWLYFIITLIILGIVFLATRRLIFYEK